MFLKKILHTKSGKYMLSIILGMGVATLFRNFCVNDSCSIKYAPPVEDVEGKKIKFNDKCYYYQSEMVTCDTKKNVVITK